MLGEFVETILCQGEKVKEKNAPLNSRWNNAGLPTQHHPEISKLEREGLFNDVEHLYHVYHVRRVWLQFKVLFV